MSDAKSKTFGPWDAVTIQRMLQESNWIDANALLLDPTIFSDADIDEILRAEGLDPDEVREEGARIARELLGKPEIEA